MGTNTDSSQSDGVEKCQGEKPWQEARVLRTVPSSSRPDGAARELPLKGGNQNPLAYVGVSSYTFLEKEGWTELHSTSRSQGSGWGTGYIVPVARARALVICDRGIMAQQS